MTVSVAPARESYMQVLSQAVELSADFVDSHEIDHALVRPPGSRSVGDANIGRKCPRNSSRKRSRGIVHDDCPYGLFGLFGCLRKRAQALSREGSK